MVATLDVNQPLFRLTKYPSGSLGEVVFLSVPLMLALLSGSMLGFLERILLANYSLEAMEGSVSGLYLCRLFQLPFMGIVLFAQVFVATYAGAKQWHRIGGCIWQMIWFSLLSFLITLPLSWLIGPLFFEGTSIEQSGSQYFYVLAAANFFYPLGAALSSFYLGQGKAKLIVISTVLAHLLNTGLDIALIFGVEGWIPVLGIRGAAFATILSQGVFCLTLFTLFMKKSHRDFYGINEWAFNLAECWKYVRVGIPRALGKILMLGIGTATIHVMTAKGGDYLMVLSIGASVVVSLSFLGDGLYQAMLTLVSHLIGSNQLHLRWKLLQSSFVFLVLLGGLLAVPLLIFPEFILSFFFNAPLEDSIRYTLCSTLHWVWFHAMGYISLSIFLSFILSLKDTLFYLAVVFFTWATSFIPVYFGMNYWHWSPDKFWAIMGLESFIFSGIYLLRLLQPKWNDFVLEISHTEVTK